MVVSLAIVIILLLKYKAVQGNVSQVRKFGLVIACIAFIFFLAIVLVLYHSLIGRDALLG